MVESTAHIVNPVVSLIALPSSNLESDAKSSTNELGSSHSLSRPLESRREDNWTASQSATSSRTFRHSEDTVPLIVGMGFNRELALQANQGSESNDVQVVMEYALDHLPSNAAEGITEQQSIEQHTNSVNILQPDDSLSDTFVDGSTKKGDSEKNNLVKKNKRSDNKANNDSEVSRPVKGSKVSVANR
jgi:hypothetical protein